MPWRASSCLAWSLMLVLSLVAAEARGDGFTPAETEGPAPRDPAVRRTQVPAPATTVAPAPPVPQPTPPALPAQPDPAPLAPSPLAPAFAAASPFPFPLQPAQPPAGLFTAPPPRTTGLAGLGMSGIPMMIGDQGANLTIRQTPSFPTPPSIPQPYPPTTPVPPPSPRQASALSPSVRGLKIAENQSPRPQDRVFFSFNFFQDVNQSLNRHFEAPVTDIRVYREIFGLEKTFDDGNGSLGLRLPLDTLWSRPTVPARFKQFGGTSTSLGDLGVFGKYILKQDPETGSLISTGLAVTPPTGPGNFAGASYIGNAQIHTTMIQPFLGYLWIRGDFYLQGFSAIEFPVNPAQVTYMYNDVGLGYFVLRAPDSDTTRFLTGLAPTFEVHVNTPLNHRDVYNANDPAGSPDVVNLTYGLNMEFRRNALLTFGFVTPVTGPRPFDLEFLLLFNVRFGRSARRATPPVISG
jgi:hypothetical protein